MTTKMESAAGASFAKSPAGILGQPNCGRPAGTAPIVLTPCAESESAALATVAAMTASSAQGTRRASLGPSTIVSSTAAETASVLRLVWPRSLAQFQTSAAGPRPAPGIPEHGAQLPAGHTDADAAEEADEHRA